MEKIEHFVIETMLPDGPHWYGGIRTKEKEGKKLQGPEWTPYFSDALFMAIEVAEIHFKTVINMEGAKIVSVEESKKDDSRWTHGDRYYMKAKYLTVKMQFEIANLPGIFTVLSVKPTHIGIKGSITGKMRKLPPNSDAWVRIAGKEVEK